MRQGRGEFFLSLSLNDFILTLLFIILLLCFWALRQKSRDLAQANLDLARCHGEVESCDPARVAALERQVAVIKEILERAGERPEEIESLVLVALEKARKLQELEQESARVKEENARLKAEKGELGAKVDELEGQVAKLEMAVSPEVRTEVAALLDENRENVSKYRACVAQMKKCGLGDPPCWADEAGKIQYIYQVTIHEEGVSALPNWPADRADDVARIPGATALPGEHLSLAQFGARAESVLAWSKRQEPRCRHYVYIRDEATSKEAFKRNLLFVENYFYKFLERN